MQRLLAAGLLAPLVLAACRSLTPAEELHELYEETADDPGTPLDAAAQARIEAGRRERIARVHELLGAEGFEQGRGRLYAAAILLDSDEGADLELARDLALEAVEAGDDGGLRVAAEAIDRFAVLEGRPQRYGTQLRYVPVTGRWSLYPVDPATSDAERRAMGVLTLEESRERLRLLNEEPR